MESTTPDTTSSDSTRVERKLRLNYSGRIIDHLGIQMYQSPVAAIAELVANAWDADATQVEITLPDQYDEGNEIVIMDNGTGMKFEDCQNRFLNVGYARRGSANVERSKVRKRRILGRKGIGKFAGFGIAEVVQIETTSGETGERTKFGMDINKLRTDEYVDKDGAEVDLLEYQEPDDDRKAHQGTTVRLKRLSLTQRRTPPVFARSMSRRFLLRQESSEFRIRVNDEDLPDSDDLQPVQFSFPAEYTKEEIPNGIVVEDDWAVERVSGHELRWRVRFYKEPIPEEESRGVSVFAGIKMVQAPFFFNLSGGLSGQHGQQYVSGRIQADFLDEQVDDLVAPERQRVNWEHSETTEIVKWGQERLKDLLSIWGKRRSEKREQQLHERIAGFSNRLDRLKSRERRTVTRAIRSVARIDTLSDSQFEEMGNSMLTAWEQGRLHDLVSDIAESENLGSNQFIEILAEAQVLTALNIAEAVKTKIKTVEGLKKRIERKELENAVRNYISDHPWLVSPQWETFAIERRVNTIIQEASQESGISLDSDFKGRVDLALSSGEHLLILEFMRPGLRLNWDHINRFDRYVRIIRRKVRPNTGGPFRRVTGYIVADRLDEDASLMDRMDDMKNNDMFAMDWDTLFANAEAQWREFLGILVLRDPDDPRLQDIADISPDHS